MSKLTKALRAYHQADNGGVMVLVSRQACDEAADLIDRLERMVEVCAHERDLARAHRDRLADTLSKIHAVMNPTAVEVEGKRYVFTNPYANEMLDILSARIRAIPDELAMAEVETPGSEREIERLERELAEARERAAAYARKEQAVGVDNINLRYERDKAVQYAELLLGLLRYARAEWPSDYWCVVNDRCVGGEDHAPFENWMKEAEVALAKNPNPSGLAAATGNNEAPLPTAGGASGPVGLGPFLDKWQERFSEAMQDDGENGVKWLNEASAKKFRTEYPALSKALVEFAQIEPAAVGEGRVEP